MITDKLKEMQVLKAKLVALENELATEQVSELAALPARYGFENVNAFLAAVRRAAGGGRRRRRAVVTGGTTRKRTRAKITDETRAAVKKLVGNGKTGAEIAAELGISLPSVQNIKKALGLVRKAKK